MTKKEKALLTVSYSFETVQEQNALVMTVDNPELVNLKSTQLFSIVLETLLEEPQAILVDLRGVKIASSLALGSLVNALQKAEKLNRKMFFRISPEVREVVELSGLEERLTLV